ncbi:hypothetical protein [Bradyrhizobium sp. sGM-13]|uniref:hypothetical protein n=1 Tax=Bradyrhizobium sp. sGM-13 TaxID=2831781 RepID=UPI001BCF4447|nr:hypothetical protein [Bradyrhizobium sp. sGM-13]
MIELIRRRDPHGPDRWKIYFGDVCIGDIRPRAGVPTTVDQLEWYCGFVPPAHRGVDAGGTAIDLHDVRQKFEAAWRNLRTAFTGRRLCRVPLCARLDRMETENVEGTAASCRRKRRMAARDASTRRD